MQADLDPRYREHRVVRRAGDRVVCEAEDRLSGRKVILKIDSPDLAQRELRTLLALPPRLGPAVVDAVWAPEKGLILVLEKLAGKTLLESVPDIPTAEMPALVQSICQCLGHLHRCGFVHTDLKPTNILLLDEREDPRVRLLDFECALGRVRDPFGEQETGGTLPYMAPELGRDWVVDGRADQYSLGVTLRQLFPELLDDSAWSAILRRLCQPTVAGRYPHILALRDELAAIADLSGEPDAPPLFGAGPIRGREEEIEALVDHVCRGSAARLLIQARSGIGLTRFMLEGLLAIVSADGPAVRLVDLGSLPESVDGKSISEFVRERSDAREAVLLGVADPSPGLHWLEDVRGEWLRKLVSGPLWKRFRLQPLDAGSFAEVVAESLGSGGAQAEELAHRLHEGGDGDLRSCAEGFASLVVSSGSRDRLAWRLDRAQLRSALAKWVSPPSGPGLGDVPKELHGPLETCARAGRSLPKEIAGDLLLRFCERRSLGRLLDHGYLQPEAGERVGFVTRSLWAEAVSQSCPMAEQIDAWLNERFTPDPDRVGETTRACQRARHLGDRETESRYLAAALERARSAHRWGDVRRLFIYPGPAPDAWSVEWVLQQVQTLEAVLGSSWSADRILYEAAFSTRSLDPEMGVALLERVACGQDARASVDAHLLLLEHAINRSDEQIYTRCLRALEQHEKSGEGPAPGVLDFHRALRAQAGGRMDEAESLAARAAERLRGSGLVHESLTLQLRAVLSFSSDARAAVDLMRAALDAAHRRERLAQIRHNLALMYARIGDHVAAAACAEAGVEALRGRVSPGRAAALRIRRAWAWMSLDRVAEAMREAHNLLNLAAVRQAKALLIPTRLLLGQGYLHRASARAAISEMARAWEEAADGCPADLRADSLNHLVDALLDLQAWDTVREYGSAIASGTAGTDPESLAATARAEALRAQADGRSAEALKVLEQQEQAGRRLVSHIAAARYLHHLGIVHLSLENGGKRSGAEAAARLFREEIEGLGSEAYGYHRGRALLCLSSALVKGGDRPGALDALNQAIVLSRRIESMGLLADCLEARARIGARRPGGSPRETHDKGSYNEARR